MKVRSATMHFKDNVNIVPSSPSKYEHIEPITGKFTGKIPNNGMPITTHLGKPIQISNINQTRSKLTTPGPYFEYWVLPQYLTHIYNQFTTVSFTVFRHSSIAHHSFKFMQSTQQFPWNQLTWCAQTPHCCEKGLGEPPPINWLTANLFYITQKCRDKLIPFLKQKKIKSSL